MNEGMQRYPFVFGHVSKILMILRYLRSVLYLFVELLYSIVYGEVCLGNLMLTIYAVFNATRDSLRTQKCGEIRLVSKISSVNKKTKFDLFLYTWLPTRSSVR